jgi:outer membrane lipoprotein LolB
MKKYYPYAVLPLLLLQACGPRPGADLSSEAPLPPSAESAQVTTQKNSAGTATMPANEGAVKDVKGVKGKENTTSKVVSNKEASRITSWQISGAMGMINKAKHKSYSGSLHWAQYGPGQYNIRMIGPMGGGTVLINKQGNTVTYKAGAKTYTSNNADRLLAQHAGIHLPVGSLYYWVRGIAAPGSVQSAQYNKAHQLVLLRQNGYTISYPRYTSVNGVALPGMVRVDGQGVSVKLAINHWKF